MSFVVCCFTSSLKQIIFYFKVWLCNMWDSGCFIWRALTDRQGSKNNHCFSFPTHVTGPKWCFLLYQRSEVKLYVLFSDISLLLSETSREEESWGHCVWKISYSFEVAQGDLGQPLWAGFQVKTQLSCQVLANFCSKLCGQITHITPVHISALYQHGAAALYRANKCDSA